MKIRENGALPLLMQIRIPPNYGQKYLLAFERVFTEISQEEEVSLIPFMLNNVALDKSLMQRDGIHPNTKAQPIIAKYLKENLLMFIIQFYQHFQVLLEWNLQGGLYGLAVNF